MKKFLPKTKNNTQGFTLVELLVVIAIIAILSVIGVTVFSGVQKNARDAKRRADVDAIATALEAKKGNDIAYQNISTGDFASGIVPVDTSTPKYCFASVTTNTAVAAPTAWNPTSVCPTSYAAFGGSVSSATNWTVCAYLESQYNSVDPYAVSSTANPAQIYCKSSTQ